MGDTLAHSTGDGGARIFDEELRSLFPTAQSVVSPFWPVPGQLPSLRQLHPETGPTALGSRPGRVQLETNDPMERCASVETTMQAGQTTAHLTW